MENLAAQHYQKVEEMQKSLQFLHDYNVFLKDGSYHTRYTKTESGNTVWTGLLYCHRKKDFSVQVNITSSICNSNISHHIQLFFQIAFHDTDYVLGHNYDAVDRCPGTYLFLDDSTYTVLPYYHGTFLDMCYGYSCNGIHISVFWDKHYSSMRMYKYNWNAGSFKFKVENITNMEIKGELKQLICKEMFKYLRKRKRNVSLKLP